MPKTPQDPPRSVRHPRAWDPELEAAANHAGHFTVNALLNELMRWAIAFKPRFRIVDDRPVLTTLNDKPVEAASVAPQPISEPAVAMTTEQPKTLKREVTPRFKEAKKK